jgi:hypothetical protein
MARTVRGLKRVTLASVLLIPSNIQQQHNTIHQTKNQLEGRNWKINLRRKRKQQRQGWKLRS